MIRKVADVIAVRELDVKGDSEVAFAVVLLIGVVVAVAVVTDVRTRSDPALNAKFLY